MTNIRRKFIDIIFPKTCINCGKTGKYLCVDCKKTLTPHPEICPYCHKISANYQTCFDCKISPYNALEGVIIPFSYSDIIKQLISRFKYKHQKDLADFLVDRLIIALQTNPKIVQMLKESEKNLLGDMRTIPTKAGIQTNNQNINQILISYIPTHRYRKHFVKGYNQSQVLAENISQKIQIPVGELLQKPHASKAQAKLQRNQRLVNLQGKFILNPKFHLQGHETLLLIDDVTTTNTTLNEAARTIKAQYPLTKIRGLVIARHN